jgi:alpha-tubulin suppressor-like RCC1 family protein
MKNTFLRFGSVVMAGLALVACREDSRQLLAPTASEKLITVQRLPRIDPEDFVEITAGDYHTCARKYNGNVYCWGQVGGPRYLTPTPTVKPILAATGAKTITAGVNHTCMLNGSGAAFCWGSSEVGQLGVQEGASTTITSGPVAAPSAAFGITPNGPLTFTAIAAGGYSTCGTTATQLFCWGELGDIRSWSPTWTAAPTFIANFNGGTQQLIVGWRQACIMVSQQLFCWGSNSMGEAGVDPAAAMYYPGTSALLFAQANTLGTVNGGSADSSFTCADLTSGTVSCFGSWSYGQLGTNVIGNGTQWSFVPQSVVNSSMQPIQLHGVSTGRFHACALDASNAPMCWGRNNYGQLGQLLSNSVPYAQSVNTSNIPVHTFRALAAGAYHSCAIGTDNHIYCWGQNNYAQIGVGYKSTNGYYGSAVQAIDPQ